MLPRSSETLNGIAFDNDEAVTRLYIISRSKITQDVTCTFTGTPTVGKQYGVTYDFWSDGAHYVIPFRHTVAPGETFADVIDDLVAQYKSDPNVTAVVGNVIQSHAVRTQHAGGTVMSFCNRAEMFVNVPSPPVTTGYIESGGAGTIHIAGGTSAIEINPFFVTAWSGFNDGILPQKGNPIGSWLFCGDTTGAAMSVHDDMPLYGGMVGTILDPADDKHTGRMDYQFSEQGFWTDDVADVLEHNGHSVGDTVHADVKQPQRDFVKRRVYKLGYKNIKDWTTIGAAIPSVTAGVYTSGMIKCSAVTQRPGDASTIVSHWSFSLTDGVLALNRLGSDIWSGVGSGFRLADGGNGIILVQIRSSDITKELTAGIAEVTYTMAGAAPYTPSVPANDMTWKIN